MLYFYFFLYERGMLAENTELATLSDKCTLSRRNEPPLSLPALTLQEEEHPAAVCSAPVVKLLRDKRAAGSLTNNVEQVETA